MSDESLTPNCPWKNCDIKNDLRAMRGITNAIERSFLFHPPDLCGQA